VGGGGNTKMRQPLGTVLRKPANKTCECRLNQVSRSSLAYREIGRMTESMRLLTGSPHKHKVAHTAFVECRASVVGVPWLLRLRALRSQGQSTCL
jgi:hypothetical protein